MLLSTIRLMCNPALCAIQVRGHQKWGDKVLEVCPLVGKVIHASTLIFPFLTFSVCTYNRLLLLLLPTCLPISVTRLGDLLDFGQLFKAFGNN